MTYAEKLLDVQGFDPLESIRNCCPESFFKNASAPEYCPGHFADVLFDENENRKCLRCWLREEQL